MADFRAAVVQWCAWAVANRNLFVYEESRPFPLFQPTPQRHIANDCSASSVLVLWLAGAPEPFPGAYKGSGNTESFGALQHVSSPLPGDFVVYGLGLPLGDQHMATVLESGSNPRTMSHGNPSSPAFVNAIEGCPPHARGRITYVRCLPVSNGPAPIPTPIPLPIAQEAPQMFCTDPTSGKVVATDADGNMYAEPGALPAVFTLTQHPQWKAGSTESGGTNPCVGIVNWLDPANNWGKCFVTKPTSGSGSFGIYDLYHFGRDGVAH